MAKRMITPFIVGLFLVSGGVSTANVVMNFTIKTLWNSTSMDANHYVELSLSSTRYRDDLIIHINAPFFNDTAPYGVPGPFPQLWNYEVVELFFLASSTNHYIELEFSPHGFYLVLLLTDRRQVLKQMLRLTAYEVQLLSTNGRWLGQVTVPRAHFPARIDRFNAYAIHGQDDKRTYEALYPAPSDSDQPDFHRLELFKPLNFELLMDVGDIDGESWNNYASCSTYAFSVLLVNLISSLLFQKEHFFF